MAKQIMNKLLNISDEHLRELEDEAIYVMREVAAQFDKKGDSLLRRQGFDSYDSYCPQGILACQDAIQPYAYRHRA